MFFFSLFNVAESKMTGFNSVTVAGHVLSSWPALKAIYCERVAALQLLLLKLLH